MDELKGISKKTVDFAGEQEEQMSPNLGDITRVLATEISVGRFVSRGSSATESRPEKAPKNEGDHPDKDDDRKTHHLIMVSVIVVHQ